MQTNRWREQAERIETLLRPQTYPLGLKVVRDRSEYPKRVKFPSDLGIRIAFCQANSIARRHGWTIGVTPEDINCWPVHLSFGWENANHEAQVKFFTDMGYVVDRKIAEVRIRAMNRARETSGRLGLDKKKIGFCIFPLAKTEVEPDLVYIYGNPAQIMRLVQGNVYNTGNPVSFSSMAAGACVSTILDVLDKGEPGIVLSGNGERVYAMTNDHELMFAAPAEKMEMIIEGMVAFHKHGQRYPIPVYQFFSPQFIGAFQDLKNSFN